MVSRLKRGGMIVALTMMGTAGVATAGPIGQTGQFSWVRHTGYYTGSGGEFTVGSYTGITNKSYVDTGNDLTSSKNIVSSPNFETFCLETGEYAASPSFFIVNSFAARGGGGVGATDQLSVGTAWLYSQFAKGTLNVSPVTVSGKLAGNYFSTATTTAARSVEAGLLQQALWWLEGEASNINDSNFATNPYAKAAGAQFTTAAGAKANAAAGYLGVYVLNNFKTAAAREQFRLHGTVSDGTKAQDFVYYSVPDGGTTLMLLGGALATLGAYRRKLNR